MVAFCPSLHCSCRKNLSYAEKQRVWSWSCGLHDLLQMQWLCSHLCYVTAANQSTTVEIELLAAVGWKWGCQPCSWPMLAKWRRTAERRFVGHVCLRNPFLPFLLGIPSIHCLAEATSWQRQHAPLALHYGCIMPISSLQLQEKDPFHAEKQSVWSRSRGQWSPRFVPNAVTVLSFVLCDCCKPINNCRDWAFSSSGLEVGLPALQLADVGKMKTHCRKEICWTCLFKGSIPAIPFRTSKHPLPGRSNFLRTAARSTSSASGLQKIPSLRCSCWKSLSYDIMQKILVMKLRSPRFVAMQWLCSQLCYVTAANHKQLSRLSF